MTGTTLNGQWRDLRCTVCQQVTGFTKADLDEVMDKDYRKNYHCNTCDRYTDQEFTGATYELIDGEKVFMELNFEQVGA